ncbi:hypothetical protein SAMN02910353_02650 [Ruminococcus sp. YRD2003]|uniref:hypothetical protein n=1 Tax=Ruminococcus sp. YRD2003 TaxID=1452313 RepID=UPI0008ADA7E3|nr:hypothetical protein SAMN02910353_02650 [Ruminococcus flavefaciens]
MKKCSLFLIILLSVSLLTGCVKLRSADELEKEASSKYGGTMVSSSSTKDEVKVEMQDEDYGFTYTIRSIEGRKQIYFDASTTKPTERTYCDYYVCMFQYFDSQCADELDEILEEMNASRKPNGEIWNEPYPYWKFTIKDKSQATSLARKCSKLVEKYDTKEKMKGHGEIAVYDENDRFILGLRC